MVHSRESVARTAPGQLKLDPEDVSLALEFSLSLLFMQVHKKLTKLVEENISIFCFDFSSPVVVNQIFFFPGYYSLF